MANYNKILLVGNLTRDPQLSYLPSQTPVVEFGLAVNRRWRAQDGQQREEVCFVDCRAYGKSAETINTYLRKGRQILVEGRLQFDQWQAQDGTKRSKHRVFVESFQFLDSQRGAAAPAPGEEGNYAPPPRRAAPAPAPRAAPPAPPAAPAAPQPQAPQPQAPQPAPAPANDEPPPAYDEEQAGGGEDIPF